MKIIIILVFQIWIISVYSFDLSYFDDLLNENKSNNNPEDIPDNTNEDITNQDNPNEEITNNQDIPNEDITNPYIPKKSNRFNKEKFNDKIHKEEYIYQEAKLMVHFYHALNQTFDMIKENFGN